MMLVFADFDDGAGFCWILMILKVMLDVHGFEDGNEFW